MHAPYDKRLGHPADFRVRYRFYSKGEGGRSDIPYQGYRSDFWYGHQDHKSNEIFMIWPEFEDSFGAVILEDNSSVAENGIARMWVIVPQSRIYHKEKIKIGLIGYFMEGWRKVAECEVIEIVGLGTNPTQSK